MELKEEFFVYTIPRTLDREAVFRIVAYVIYKEEGQWARIRGELRLFMFSDEFKEAVQAHEHVLN
jgi:hypothetical protein